MIAIRNLDIRIPIIVRPGYCPISDERYGHSFGFQNFHFRHNEPIQILLIGKVDLYEHGCCDRQYENSYQATEYLEYCQHQKVYWSASVSLAPTSTPPEEPEAHDHFNQ
jgi:hypothetical protein